MRRLVLSGFLLFGLLLKLSGQDTFYGLMAGTRANFSSLTEPIPKEDYAFVQGRALHGWELYGFYRWEWDGWYVESQFGFFSAHEEVFFSQESPEQYDFVGTIDQDNLSAMIFGGAKFKDIFRVYLGLINTLNVGSGISLVDGSGEIDRVNMGYGLGVGMDLDVFMRMDLVYRSFLLDQETKVSFRNKEQTLEKNMYSLSIEIGIFFD